MLSKKLHLLHRSAPDIPELEQYRIKLFQIDAAVSTIPPIVALAVFGYPIEKNPAVLLMSLGLLLFVAITIALPRYQYFEAAKLIRVLGVYFGTVVAELLFPFYQHEYLFLPLMVFTIILTYPFKNTNISSSMILLLVSSTFILVFIEDASTYNAIYATFNQVHLFSVAYTFFIAVWITHLIQRKSSELILQNQKVIEGKNEELVKYIDSNVQLETMARVTAHDLKSPMRTIASFSKLLASKVGSKLSGSEKQYLQFIEEGTVRLSNFVDELLHYSMVNSEPMKLEMVNVPDLVHEVLQDLAYEIEEKKVGIDEDHEIDTVCSDRTKLKQVFQNLLANAIKFSQPETAHIRIRSKSLEEQWQFSIEDNGIGIPAGVSDGLFDANVRLHQDLGYEGSGLGLNICKKIVVRHLGKIWYEPANPGSKFLFTIAKQLKETTE